MKNETTTAVTTVKTPTAVAKVGVLNSLAARLQCDPAKLQPMLKKTAFSTCRTDEEFMAMCIVANTYGLNPILKEVYAFPSKGGAVVPIVGVDGWIKMMNANPAFDGIEFEETDDACTAIIHRKDRAHPIKATEWLAECIGTTDPWKRWPRRMLRHKAMIQAARIAFGFSGIYDEDEAARIESATAPATALEQAKKPSLHDVLKLREGAEHKDAEQDAPTEQAAEPAPATPEGQLSPEDVI